MIPNKCVYRVETRTGEAFWMRRTTATTDYLKESMGTALLELMQENRSKNQHRGDDRQGGRRKIHIFPLF